MKNTAFFGLFAALVCQASSATFEAARDSFCKDPHAFICSDAAESLREFRARRKEMADKAFGSTLTALKGTLTAGAMKAIYDGVQTSNDPAAPRQRKLDLALADVAPFFVGIRHYLAELEKLSAWKKADINVAITKIKQLHFDRIDAEPSFTKDQRAEMKKKVEEVRVLAFDELFSFFEGMGIKWERDLETSVSLLGTFATSCGADFLRDNANMSTMSIQKNYREADGKEKTVTEPLSIMVLCPGALLFAKTRKQTTLVTPSMLHELGHAYDAGFFRPAFEKFAACLYKDFGKSPEMTWATKAPADLPRAFWNTTNEVLADLGSAAILAKLLPVTLEGLTQLKEGLAHYCGAVPGTHPSGKFRVGNTYGANPDLRLAMGCPKQEVEPATCTLDGSFPK